MIDPLEILIAYLKTVSAVTTILGSSNLIYGLRLPYDYAGGRALVLIPQSSPKNQGTPLMRFRYQARCYAPESSSETAEEQCMEIYQDVADALHDVGPFTVAVTGGNGVIAYSRELSGGQVMPDGDTGWDFALAMFESVVGTRLFGV
jgi:hypothetical protein